jgi:4-amino-4-deoxy-L-arabinose transferase-like glycosyltransferase
MALGYQAFGVSNFVTRMWSPVFAVLTMVFVYLLGRELFNRYVGFISSLLLGIMALFYSFAKHAMTDIVFVFFVVASIYFFVLSQKHQRNLRPLALSGIFFGLALLTKQVEALLIPLIVVTYFAISQKSVRFLFTKRFALFWGTGLIILFPWLFYMFVNFGSGFWNWFVVYCGFLRVVNPLEGHGGGYLFYFDYLIRNETIWALLLPVAVGLCGFRFLFRQSKADTLLVSWIIVVILIFTFAQTKLAWYILPAYPAFAIAIGSLFFEMSKKLLKLRYKHQLEPNL